MHKYRTKPKKVETSQQKLNMKLERIRKINQRMKRNE